TELALVRVMRRQYDQSTKLPEEFVTSFSHLTSRALSVWTHARRRSDFSLFAPLLEEVVAMCRRQAEYLGYPEEPYDALLDLHEEGLTTSMVVKMFAGLREPLRDMVRKLRTVGGRELRFAEPFRQEEQIAFAEKMLAAIGFDFKRGRQDLSAHPFTTSIGHHDHRVTNRYHPHSLEFIFSALHEGGHALYEQNIADSLEGTALDSGISLGVHESQSRLWENVIGRSLPFWEHFYPELRQAFPAQFADLPLSEFVSGLNLVRPGPIRVEADEVSYNLHVLIRFELEKALIDGTLAVRDLPAAWDQRYREDLDVRVDRDADGVLQDIHWSHGSFGYFPTYTIGNLAAAQIWEAYRGFDSETEKTLRRGELAKIRNWLTERIYRHGSIYPPGELIVNVTGKPLDAEGVLQDIHWSHGSFGYFPTYTIGNLAAAQIWEAYRGFDHEAETTLRRGKLAKIRSWLTEQIYRHGSIYLPKELIVNVTGKPLGAKPFLGYLGKKFQVGEFVA
ncbi:MAG: carboxypeptidase M32, partial [Deltaproteobacteria bacterium]